MGHPAAFPVGLPEFFIKLFTKEGDNVLDPFAGSGSTGVAAENLSRNVTLVDAERDYFNTMIARLGKKRSLHREIVYVDCSSQNGADSEEVPAQPNLLEKPLEYAP